MGAWARVGGFLYSGSRYHVVDGVLRVDPVPFWVSIHFDIRRTLFAVGLALALASLVGAEQRRYAAAAILVSIVTLVFFTGRGG